MNALDELRKKMHARQVGTMGAIDNFTENTRRRAWEQAIAMLDSFEAAHPGLKDFTVMCCNCGVLFDDDDAWWAPELFMGEKEAEQVCETHLDDLDGWSGVHVCPACAKEATP